MTATRDNLDIAFVSDVACPWCAIGLSSLDQALARVEGEIESTVRIEPFELNPNMAAAGEELVPYLGRKYGRTPEQVAKDYTQYGPLKADTAAALIEFLRPVQQRYRELEADPNHVLALLAKGADKARGIAEVTLARARDAMGLVPPS